MDSSDGLVFSGHSATRWTTVDAPTVLANRMQTRERSCTLTDLAAEVSGGSPVQVAILDRKGAILVDQTLPAVCEREAAFVWQPVPPVRLPAETTFYLAVRLVLELRFRVSAGFPLPDPAFVDLGTWHSAGPLGQAGPWCPSAGLRAFAANFRFRPGKADVASARQREILELAAEGHPDKEIARRLRVSPDTVDFQWRRTSGRFRSASGRIWRRSATGWLPTRGSPAPTPRATARPAWERCGPGPCANSYGKA